ncbi:hypothetical protein [Mycobacterium sp. 852002-10029_SCH5224772]|uniref:hypothetical protein n=1 Tax=Mycobacterium sp. 852002-10029_SCH5224772 TaxID=1834083 RepID=UPI000801FB8C|nr:hypothetical protein [Mycobacterium sp. 852002-10029_SCH5224772]OBF05078.1 hypothetical protein A5775_22820 [Mycobacterium sp. 852002-10029_SCH5224772]
MREPFIGSEAVASGLVTPYALRSRFVKVHPDVYVPAHTALTPGLRAQSAWLWSRRRGVVAGRSAAALYGTKWIDDRAPAELLYGYRRPPSGIHTWSDRLSGGEIQTIAGMPVTTPARTALDIACRYPVERAVAAIDALSRATDLKVSEVELLAERYRGRRGIARARIALPLVDAGAESPRETWLRLLLVRAGFPTPQTQIPVYDAYGFLIAALDMGWEDIKLAIEYEGDHHRFDQRQFNKDIRRAEALAELGWTNVRITVEDTPGGIIGRVAAAWQRRTCTQREDLAKISP